MKLGTRLTLIYLLIISLCLVILGALVSNLLKSHFMQDSKETLLAEARSIGTLLSGDDSLTESNLQRKIKKVSADLNADVTIIAPDGRVIADSRTSASSMGNLAERPEVKEAFERGAGMAVRKSNFNNIERLYAAVPLGSNSKIRGAVRLSIPMSKVEGAFYHIHEVGALSTVFAGFVAIILGYFFVRSITSPIKEMTQMAEQIAAGDLTPRTKLAGGDEIGKLAESLNIMADQLSARMKALINSQRRRQTLIDHMTDGILLLSAGRSVVIANPTAQNLLSLKADRLLGRPLSEIVPAEELSDAISEAAKVDEVVDRTFEIQSKQRRIVRAEVLSIKEDDEEAFLVVLHDVTREKSLERMRKDFVANFSHELKTPITGLRLLAEALSDSIKEEREEAAYFAEVIKDETGRLASFVEKLMDLARLDAYNLDCSFEPVSVSDVIEEVVSFCEPLAKEKKLNLNVDLSGDLPPMIGDRGQLRMLFQNLIENAIKYTARGSVTVSAERSGRDIEVRVSDTGIGIEQRDLPRIFERFFRADRARSRTTGGVGLGLSIVSRIVNNHKGKVEVESELGKGSTFKVLLPVEPSEFASESQELERPIA